MKATKKVKVRNGYPVYVIAVVFLLAAFLVRVHSVIGWIVVAAVAAVAYLLARSAMPDDVLVVEEEVPDPEPDDPEVAALKKERDRAIGEMRRINENIPDLKITGQIDHIEMVTARIFDHVMEHTEKKGQIRRFMNYYLPTTIKLLNEYDRMENLGVSGSNIDASKRKIEEMLNTVCAAFDKQLDALFANVVMDITADVTVLQNMMKQEGLSDSDFE